MSMSDQSVGETLETKPSFLLSDGTLLSPTGAAITDITEVQHLICDRRSVKHVLDWRLRDVVVVPRGSTCRHCFTKFNTTICKLRSTPTFALRCDECGENEYRSLMYTTGRLDIIYITTSYTIGLAVQKQTHRAIVELNEDLSGYSAPTSTEQSTLTPRSNEEQPFEGKNPLIPATFDSGGSASVLPGSHPSLEELRPESIISSSSRASTYHSAVASFRSISTYATAFSRLNKPRQHSAHLDALVAASESEYQRLVREKGLLLPPSDELNWSNKGQHVEFGLEDMLPLEIRPAIGHSATALVDQVICRRVKLARKSMSLTRKTVLETALNEVIHLQRIRHPHVIQLVGTYLQGKTFALLLYPVCDWNLSDYMEGANIQQLWELPKFFTCLVNGVNYIHSALIKHMDIKPKNILVRKRRKELAKSILVSGLLFHSDYYQVYIADFGISRNFEAEDQSQTDSLTARSPRYCAPEVAIQDQRGRGADVFSLGCVFVEMLTVLARRSFDDLEEYTSSQSGSFHDNLPRVQLWLTRLDRDATSWEWHSEFSFGRQDHRAHYNFRPVIDVTRLMLRENPMFRPTASRIQPIIARNDKFFSHNCCEGPREAYEVST
ncbi:MAG: hypothetical protein M1812_003251 [Candelaria pacifica]|nr:MAG: hypothetical protein M1812_003251 [Candelaria pacifica]